MFVCLTLFDQSQCFSNQEYLAINHHQPLCEAHKSEKIIHKLLLQTTAIGNKHWAQVPDGHVAVVPRLKVVWLVWLLILVVMLWLYHTAMSENTDHGKLMQTCASLDTGKANACWLVEASKLSWTASPVSNFLLVWCAWCFVHYLWVACPMCWAIRSVLPILSHAQLLYCFVLFYFWRYTIYEIHSYV